MMRSEFSLLRDDDLDVLLGLCHGVCAMVMSLPELGRVLMMLMLMLLLLLRKGVHEMGVYVHRASRCNVSPWD